ncbi:ankyrin repeat protein [Penicillium malachiteum]|nr:ankyrin repeat protein [Penicillium malachiteum]
MAAMKSMESADQYTIGWIAALPIERAAAIAILDERHNKPQCFLQHPADSNSYTWGRVGEHKIVIASLPAGLYGPTSAATMASNLLSSLPQIRVSLLVGICGGIARPDQGRDIRLGDIAMSQPQGTSGGVIQYDLSKGKSDNKWEQKGFLSMPPLVLLNALANLQAKHEAGEIRLPEILDLMPKLKKGVNGCCDCDGEELIERSPRDTTEPEVHYGVIVSGSTLVKDATTRDMLAERVGEECICFEMEAAGLMNAFPCLVI